MSRWAYAFGTHRTDGDATMKALLGGKGANLAEMTRIGIPVPPGFTLTTAACNAYFQGGGRFPTGLVSQAEKALASLERQHGRRFGDPNTPLLVSVRSGAMFSMPGMMDTILNLGLNDRSARGLAESSGDARFAYDSYRRFIQMYADVVLELGKEPFDKLLEQAKRRRRVTRDMDLTARDLISLTERFKDYVKKTTGRAFPQDAKKQLWGAVRAVFRSWNNDRAKIYRRQYGIADSLGTAVNIQCMVFGNTGEDCATGVAFTRDPASGENKLYGEYLINAQGEDVVAGIRTPLPIRRGQSAEYDEESLEARMPKAYRELLAIRKKLEQHYCDMQDVEFTIEHGKLFMLQTRTGKRTGRAALKIAFDLHRSKRIDRKEVVRRVDPEMVTQLMAPEFEPAALLTASRDGRLLATGLPAGPGAATGHIALTAKTAASMAAAGKPVLLVRAETSPEDIGGMLAAEGIVTSRGGMTSHAAVVARGMGKPCIVGAEALEVDEKDRRVRVGRTVVKEGDLLSMDGGRGWVLTGGLEPQPSEIQESVLRRASGKKPKKGSSMLTMFERLMRWADAESGLSVRTNADTPRDALVARALGARGIGLCRTEHMFFGDDRIAAMREMILARDEEGRRNALRKLLPMQRRDFVGIFKAMDGYPVTIRLLDPPLHEFLPTEPRHFRQLAKDTGRSVEAVERLVEQLRETNPMLGHRGCRLGLTVPAIYEMQATAIIEAAISCRSSGIRVLPEIMIPLVGTLREYTDLESLIRQMAGAVMARKKSRVRFLVGTMIEIPRACLIAEQIAQHAEFFSFGTNDLTQLTYGYSRDDVARFLPEYIQQGILPGDPFESMDPEGVGKLVATAIDGGRAGRKDLKLGVCGEHGGDPASVRIFHELGLNYVSCSPYRVPVARLAAAQARLSEGGGSGTA
ncbi:MAG: pyruvate, phosphate dikinase [Acidobacteriota bacterium]|nr:pyruvate, phosphate dikinase [Acidobacteriota bacterium]MDH3784956.1 pyruvate, phosphate dikinase [Acidobacteriota bacterium]